MAEEQKEEWYLEKSSQELDFEARLAAEKGEVAPEVKGREFAVEGNELEGYAGTSPEYMTYANETEKPLMASGGAEAVIEERIRTAEEERAENSKHIGRFGYADSVSLAAAEDEGKATASDSASSKMTEDADEVANQDKNTRGNTNKGVASKP